MPQDASREAAGSCLHSAAMVPSLVTLRPIIQVARLND